MIPVDDPCWFSSQQLCHREKYQPISWYNSLLDGNPLLKSLQNSSHKKLGLGTVSYLSHFMTEELLFCSYLWYNDFYKCNKLSLWLSLWFFRSNMTIYMYFLVDVVDWNFFYLVNFEFTFKRFHLLFFKTNHKWN